MVQAIIDVKSARGALGGDTLPASVGEIAPHLGRGGEGVDEHFVQFYESDEFLLGSLAGFVADGLSAGDACIVVARGERREGLDEHLRTRGLDPEAARLRGQFFTLDAAETLARLMVEDVPEASRFEEVVGGLIARAADGPRRVRIFGEMVALLWAEGNRDAALRLEALWNGLQKTRTFVLFCAYPMSGFGAESHAGPLGHVCAEHTRIIPAESYTAHAGADERLLAIIELQRKAATLEAEIAERREAEAALRSVKEDLERVAEERQRLLERERAARAEAEEANRLKDEFLATVSHELRTPLTAIIGWAHMLRHKGLDEATVLRGLETVERNAQVQAQLVEDILDVSRVISGNLRLERRAGRPGVGRQRGRRLGATGGRFEGHPARSDARCFGAARLGRRGAAPAGRLEPPLERHQVHAGGRARRRAPERARRESAELLVCDDGCGVSPDFLPHVFERFRQADGTSTRRHGGLGLGLSIARHLVELHGGTITVDSPGEEQGTTFTVRLPLADRA